LSAAAFVGPRLVVRLRGEEVLGVVSAMLSPLVIVTI
jgi:hypothetical protein